jgi:hypothetical protein
MVRLNDAFDWAGDDEEHCFQAPQAESTQLMYRKERSRIVAGPSLFRQTRSGIASRGFQILISLLLSFLDFRLAIGSRTQALNRLPQAHRLRARSVCTSSR